MQRFWHDSIGDFHLHQIEHYMNTPLPEKVYFQDDGVIPNNILPLLIYRKAIDAPVNADKLDQQLAGNNWTNSWRDGIYPFHHYHSNTHEVLIVIEGSAALQLGGPKGEKLEVQPGDVLIIPAGVGHKCVSHSNDFLVLGAYPDGLEPDLQREDEQIRIKAKENIGNVPLPLTDPLSGASAGLVLIWGEQQNKNTH
jgi:uncharacterized protein YjlB